MGVRTHLSTYHEIATHKVLDYCRDLWLLSGYGSNCYHSLLWLNYIWTSLLGGRHSYFFGQDNKFPQRKYPRFLGRNFITSGNGYTFSLLTNEVLLTYCRKRSVYSYQHRFNTFACIGYISPVIFYSPLDYELNMEQVYTKSGGTNDKPSNSERRRVYRNYSTSTTFPIPRTIQTTFTF